MAGAAVRCRCITAPTESALSSATVDGGVTLLDSAEMYPVPQRAETQGRSEEFLGRWLRETGCRSRVVVATKVAGPAGMAWLRDGPLRLDAAAIRAARPAFPQSRNSPPTHRR